MFGGMDIITAKAGTVIKSGDEELTVTEADAVIKGWRIYVTKKMADATKARSVRTKEQ